MHIKSSFDIHEPVIIKDIKLPGVIDQLQLSSLSIDDLQYHVEYWWDGEMRGVWLHSWELEHSRKKISLSEERPDALGFTRKNRNFS